MGLLFDTGYWILDARQILDDLIPIGRLEVDVFYRGYSINDLRKWIAFFLIILSFQSLQAQTVQYNEEFQITSVNAGYAPVLCGLPGGGYVICWNVYQNDGDIIGQLYHGNGTKDGEEFQVNTHISGSQVGSSISSLSDGGFVVCWQSDQDGTRSSIFGQMFENDGTKRGAEFKVNTYINNWQENPQVDGLVDGGFVVCWSSFGQDGDGDGIFGQIYNNDGTNRGKEFQVNTYTNNFQNNPDVSGLSDGSFVVCWHSQNQDGGHKGIYGQLFENDGTNRGGEFQINTYTNDDQASPSVYGLTGGGFVSCWTSLEQDGSFHGVYGQMYDNFSNKRGGEFQVNTYTENGQNGACISGLLGGGFLVCWQSFGQDGSWYGIYAQLFYSDGSKHGTEFQVNSHVELYQVGPRTCELSNGDFIICWDNLDNSGENSFCKYFLGTPLVHSLYSFSLKIPLYDETLNSTTVNFEWQKASQIHLNFQWELEYSLYLDQSEDFINPQKYSGIYDTTYSLQDLTPGQTYFWKVLAKNIEGDSLWSSEIFGFYVSPAAAIENDLNLKPETFKLYANYPNPFNPSTVISYHIPVISDVELSIYNLLGQKVKMLVSEKQSAGHHTFEWDAGEFASGVYFYRIEAGEFQDVKKMILLR